METYKKHTTEKHSFLVNDTTTFKKKYFRINI